MTSHIPPHLPAGERLRRAGVAAWSVIGLTIVAVGIVWVLLKVSVILPPLVIALLIIYVLNPPITRLTARGMPRVLASIFVFIAAVALVALLALAAAPFLSSQVSAIADDWPQFRRELFVFVQDGAAEIEERFGLDLDTSRVACLLSDEEVVEGRDCGKVTESFEERVVEGSGGLTSIGRSVLDVLLVFVLGPLLALYLLIDLPQLQRDLIGLFPVANRAEAADIGGKIARAVGGFFRGQLLVAAAVGVMSAVGFRIIGLPFWLVIGLIAGFFNLIPLVGPFIGGAIGFLVGTVTGGVGLGVKAAIVELIVQQLDNHIISPQVMKRAVELHPATVALSILAGGAVGGFWGLLLGVPTVAVAKILLGHLWATRVLGEQVTPFTAPRPPRSPPVARVPGRSGPLTGPQPRAHPTEEAPPDIRNDS